jgi:hypothetical protein
MGRSLNQNIWRRAHTLRMEFIKSQGEQKPKRLGKPKKLSKRDQWDRELDC